MFTGIVRELGRVVAFDGGRLVIEAPKTTAEIGDSIAVDGVCLTVVEHDGDRFAFDVVTETLSRSTLGALTADDRVNIEPALRAGEPLGGHMVQGHVDDVGRVRSISPQPVWIDAPPDVLRYCVEKGSIAVDGISLTIAALDDGGGFAVALVPHTLAATTLGAAKTGDAVNLEVDVLAKYVERLTMGR
jgi:riboflavin synthase